MKKYSALIVCRDADGQLELRATSRGTKYCDLLKDEGYSILNVVDLGEKISKAEMSQSLLDHPLMQQPELRDLLAKWAPAKAPATGVDRLGYRLQRAREGRGLSIQEAAIRLHRSKESVWAAEYYDTVPRDGLAPFAKLYRVSEDWLRTGAQIEDEQTSSSETKGAVLGLDLEAVFWHLAQAREKLSQIPGAIIDVQLRFQS
jgi:transcriptional regulator with XRE-family HTH domain